MSIQVKQCAKSLSLLSATDIVLLQTMLMTLQCMMISTTSSESRRLSSRLEDLGGWDRHREKRDITLLMGQSLHISICHEL